MYVNEIELSPSARLLRTIIEITLSMESPCPFEEIHEMKRYFYVSSQKDEKSF